jgi:predicted ester cyclase
MDRAESEAFYRRYLDRCNAHEFGALAEFLDPAVEVNGERCGVERYAAGLRDVVAAFPDFHWRIQQILVDGDWLAVRLRDTGTGRDGQAIALQEFAIYHLVNGTIAAVWGDLEPERLQPPTR